MQVLTTAHPLPSPQVRGSAPPPRVGHCAAVLGNLMIVFGGFVPSVAGGTPSEILMAEGDGGGSVLSARRSRSSRHARGGAEGHHVQPPQPQPQPQPPLQQPRGSYSNALYALHLERRSWSLPTVHLAPGAAPPAARLGASAVAVHDVEVLFFGG